MKLQFGSAWLRILRGGIRLTPIEQQLLVAFREHIPPSFHMSFDAQLDAINLAQRHAEWKGINLYRIRHGKVYHDDLPPLPCSKGEVKLLSLSIAIPGIAEPLHVAYWSVQRFFFGFGTGESLRPIQAITQLAVRSSRQSWRSNAELPQPNSSFESRRLDGAAQLGR